MLKKLYITVITSLALPFAYWWIRHNEKIALRLGRELNDEELKWAEQLTLQHPEKVRVLNVTRIPSLVPAWIQKFVRRRGFPADNAAGMCMRYGIYLVEKYSQSKSLLAHEMVHTHQFERLGGIWKFLREYFHQTLLLGYINAPLENEANTKAEEVIVEIDQLLT